jgi:probable F420-dependent oxidoreductase
MKFWNALPFMEPSESIELAVASDEAGFDGVTVPDHLFYPRELQSKYPYSEDGKPGFDERTPWPDPWVLIGAMAARTKQIHFTTNVYIAPARDLFTVAKLVSTAAVISNDRVALGVGAGWMREEFEQTGQDFDKRGKRLNEMIPLLKKLWTGDWVSHKGDHYEFGDVKIAPVPKQPIPIWIGGHSKAALRRAVDLADGWIGVDYQLNEAHKIFHELRELRAGSPRSGEPFDIIVALWAEIDAELCRRLEGHGVTGLLCAPWMFAKDKSVHGRIDAVKQFADDVIAKAR